MFACNVVRTQLAVCGRVTKARVLADVLSGDDDAKGSKVLGVGQRQDLDN